MARNYFEPATDEQVRKLEDRLFHLLRMILDRLPEAIANATHGMYGLETREAVWVWLERLGGVVIDNAVPIRNERQAAIARMTNGGERAYCPMCGEGAMPPAQGGFALPAGLEMHLFSKKSARLCTVMHEIREQALDRVVRIEIKARRQAELHEAAAKKVAAAEKRRAAKGKPLEGARLSAPESSIAAAPVARAVPLEKPASSSVGEASTRSLSVGLVCPMSATDLDLLTVALRQHPKSGDHRKPTPKNAGDFQAEYALDALHLAMERFSADGNLRARALIERLSSAFLMPPSRSTS